MLHSLFYILLIILLSKHGNLGDALTIVNNNSEAKALFVDYYIRAYSLRTLNSTENKNLKNGVYHQNHFVLPNHQQQHPENILEHKTSIDWAKAEEDMVATYEKCEKAAKMGKLSKVIIKGNNLQAIQLAANEIWERTGGELVSEVEGEILGEIGVIGGSYIGGTIGMALGILFPEIAIPLVLGGNFLGTAYGTALLELSSKIATKLTNEWIEDNIIDPTVKDVYFDLLNNTMVKDSKNKSKTCNTKKCIIGAYKNGCGCSDCSGPMQYQDEYGMGSCKTCPSGYCGCNQADPGPYGCTTVYINHDRCTNHIKCHR